MSYASGIAGGVFAPSLAVGYFAGVVQAPITAFVIVMEMTDNHNMVLPLMATALIATAVSRLICPRPLYRTLAERFFSASRPLLKGPLP